MAIERYVSVCHPHYVGFSEAGKMAVTGVILFSIVFNINRFFEYRTCFATEVSSLYNWYLGKGQLISKCPYEKSVWTKYQQKYFRWYFVQTDFS